MGETTTIAWTDATWNAVRGCSHVSPGCEHCYAETMSTRFGWTTLPWGAQNAGENVQLQPHKLLDPLKYKGPKRVFVNSLSDFWHPIIPDSYRDDMMAVMLACPEHTFQILTKRPREMHDYLVTKHRLATIEEAAARITYKQGRTIRRLDDGCNWEPEWPLPNVWIGISAEDQRRAAERIPYLLDTPAVIRFVSAEPLLGPINFERLATPSPRRATYTNLFPLGHAHSDQRYINALRGSWWDQGPGFVATNRGCTAAKLDWIIVGGESGPDYRPMSLDWARDIRDSCIFEHTAFFYKQGSGLRPGMDATLDGLGWKQFPLREESIE